MRFTSHRLRLPVLVLVAALGTSLLPGSATASARSQMPGQETLLAQVFDWLTSWLPEGKVEGPIPAPPSPAHRKESTSNPCHSASIDPNGICSQTTPTGLPTYSQMPGGQGSH